MNTYVLKRGSIRAVPWIVLLLIIVTELATGIYTPSLPRIAEIFGISELLTEMTITVNIIGIALSGLLYGPLSDAIGRRRVILFGITLFVIASILCTFSESILHLTIMRFVQGIGAGVAIVVGIAAIKDLYDATEAAKLFALLGMVISLSPGIAPIVGGYLASDFPWWSPFALIALLGMPTLLMVFLMLPETLPKSQFKKFSLKKATLAYQALLTNLNFMKYVGIRVLTMGWFWGEMANLPFIYIEGMSLTPQHYGYVWGVGMGVYCLANVTLKKLLNYVALEKALLIGLQLCLLSCFMQAMAFLVIEVTPISAHFFKLPGIFGLALIISTSTALALGKAGSHIGASNALMIGLQMGLGAIIVMLESTLYNGGLWPVWIVTTVLSSAAYFLAKTKT